MRWVVYDLMNEKIVTNGVFDDYFSAYQYVGELGKTRPIAGKEELGYRLYSVTDRKEGLLSIVALIRIDKAKTEWVDVYDKYLELDNMS